MNKYFIGQLLLNENVSDCVRKQLRKLCPELKISNDEISTIITSEIVKREIVDSEAAEEAKKKIIRMNRSAFKKAKKELTT